MPRIPNRAGHETGPDGPASLARRGLALAASLLLVIALVAACGGSDDDDNNSGPDDVVMSTFTPIPPDFTPEAIQTRSARGTAFAQTSTAQSNVTPTAPSGTPAEGSPSATASEGEIRPPDAVLRTTGGDTVGVIGNSNYVEPVTGTGAQIDAPYVPLPGDAVSWASGAAAQIEVPNSPYAVRSATIEIYTYDDNVALPQTADGVPTGEIAFFRQTEPAQQMEVPGPALTVTPQLAPGNYIVSARIIWDAPPNVIAAAGEQFTQYVYVIRVS